MLKETDKNSVLIVDDESANLMSLTHILSPEYNIYAAKNGQEAIELAKEYLPDVILLDILMPEMDGYEVLSVLKETEETLAIPVIFLTGLTNADAEEKGLGMGAADYITKPCVPAIVKLRIRNQIQTLKRINIIKQQPEPPYDDMSPAEFGGGDGKTPDTAYEISGKSQMMKLARDVNNGTSYSGFYFRIDCDIDLEGMEWTSIGYCVGPYEKHAFQGFFDGGGYAVSNFRIEDQGNRSAGLFGYIEHAVIQNLYVKEFEINGGAVVGGLTGYSETSTISNCYAEGRIESGSANAGGMVGIACNSQVENCASTVMMNVYNGSTAGGLCGLAYNASRFTNCESQGSLRAENMASAGGFAGSVKDCGMENCRAKLSVTCRDCSNVGGFCGSGRNCTFDRCMASGNVRTASDDMSSIAGGFIGFTNSVVTRCIASGDVLMGGEHGVAGGFVGEVSRASIHWCYSCGTVASESCVGGFAGMAHCVEGSTNIENCYTLSEVASYDETTQAGGFIGTTNRGGEGNVVIAACYSFGKLSPNVKGFTSSHSTGSILNCVWRKDKQGINEYATDGLDTQAFSTGQFGDAELFARMSWSIIDEDNIWHYDDGINPKRPHLNGLPVVNPE